MIDTAAPLGDPGADDPEPRRSRGKRAGQEPKGDPQSTVPNARRKVGVFGQLVTRLRSVVHRALPPTALNGTASLADMVRAHDEGDQALGDEERLMLLNLLKFRSQRVEDVMVPRADIVAVEVDTPLAELIGVFQEAGHSRLPVYRETLDDPIGMIHLKDVVACFQPETASLDDDGAGAADTVAQSLTVSAVPALVRLKRDVLFVPPSMPAIDLLLQMQAKRVHMALVIDEYGGTDGLVTIEDLIEMIIGDIEDEHDKEEEPFCAPLDGGGFLVDARLEIEDFQEVSGLDLALDDGEEDEVDTMGGLVFTMAGRVPRRGEIIVHPKGLDIEIVDADARRIRRMKIIPQAERLSGA